MPIVWIHRGPWAETFREMSADDAERAAREQWGQNIEGLNPAGIAPAERGPHPAADAYFAEMTGGKRRPLEKPTETPKPPQSQRSLEADPDPEVEPTQTEPASGSGTYPTRELRAREPVKKHPPRKGGKARH